MRPGVVWRGVVWCGVVWEQLSHPSVGLSCSNRRYKSPGCPLSAAFLARGCVTHALTHSRTHARKLHVNRSMDSSDSLRFAPIDAVGIASIALWGLLSIAAAQSLGGAQPQPWMFVTLSLQVRKTPFGVIFYCKQTIILPDMKLKRKAVFARTAPLLLWLLGSLDVEKRRGAPLRCSVRNVLQLARCAKRLFGAMFLLNTIVLPRQARDKHREKLRKRGVFVQASSAWSTRLLRCSARGKVSSVTGSWKRSESGASASVRSRARAADATTPHHRHRCRRGRK